MARYLMQTITVENILQNNTMFNKEYTIIETICTVYIVYSVLLILIHKITVAGHFFDTCVFQSFFSP